MKKLILLSIFVLIFLFLPKNAFAANECASIWVEPGTSALPGTTFTFRAAGCPPSNVGYSVRLLDKGQQIVELDMVDLTGDRSQYAATITQTASLLPGRYGVMLVDNSANNPIQGTTIVIEGTSTIDCNVASFSESRILHVCIGGFDAPDGLNSTNALVRCNEATFGDFCFTPFLVSLASLTPSDDGGGKFFGCFTTEPIDPIVRNVSIEFQQGTTPICSINNIDVSAGRPGYLCYPNGDATKNGIKSALGCIPVDNVNDILIFFVRWTMGIIGGVATILIIIGAFQIITSQGDKYKLQSGKDILTAAITGLMLAIFAIFVVQLFGENILQIF